jgi:hypothetical protein
VARKIESDSEFEVCFNRGPAVRTHRILRDTAECAFTGGPVDGQIIALEHPPPVYEITRFDGFHSPSGDFGCDAEVQTVRVRYRRETRSDGRTFYRWFA